MITVHNLKKTYTVHKKEPGLWGSVKAAFVRKKIEKHALKGVSLTVESGEILGLIGANGAGKTTLVKALTGIIHPSSGEAKILGFTPWERKREFQRQVALIMGQKAQLWWDLPAADCFILLREIYQIPKAEFEERVNYLAKTLQVQDLLTTQIRRLSLGERMKMELMAALLHQPRVVFLDEPTIGLDITAQRAIREFILEYRAQHSPAMILTSHYMEDIERLCKRIVILREGEIVYDGELAHLMREYAPDKIITAELSLQSDKEGGVFPEQLGQVIAHTPTQIKIKTPRSRVPEASGQILKQFSVTDLRIDEEDIANIIESIMKKGRVA